MAHLVSFISDFEIDRTKENAKLLHICKVQLMGIEEEDDSAQDDHNYCMFMH